MNRKYVFGVYTSLVEAEQAVDHIIQNGVPRESVAVAGGDKNDYHGTVDYISYSELQEENQGNNRSFFERLFGIGETDDLENYDDIDFSQYEDSLSRNEVLVLVDQAFEAELTSFNPETIEDENR